MRGLVLVLIFVLGVHAANLASRQILSPVAAGWSGTHVSPNCSSAPLQCACFVDVPKFPKVGRFQSTYLMTALGCTCAFTYTDDQNRNSVNATLVAAAQCAE